jgi:hypothetical protein
MALVKIYKQGSGGGSGGTPVILADSGTGSSVRCGVGSCASGDYSFAFGQQATASGNYSLAYGCQTTAIKDYSSVSGWSNSANGDWTTSKGRNNTSNASHATSSGVGSFALCDYSEAFGQQAFANGNYARAKGLSAFSNGDFSIAFGRCVTSNGCFSSVHNGVMNYVDNLTNSAYTNYGVIVNGNGNNTTGGVWNGTEWTTFPTNTDSGCFSFVGNGFQNNASGCCFNSVINGLCNYIGHSVSFSNTYGNVIVNGNANNTTGGVWNGTQWTTAPTPTNMGIYEFIGNGFQNQTFSSNGTILNGFQNTNNNANLNFIFGECNIHSATGIGQNFIYGCSSISTLNSQYSFVGGKFNINSGVYSFAFGKCLRNGNISNSTTSGYCATACGEHSSAHGCAVESSGNYSFVYGSGSCDNYFDYTYVLGCNIIANRGCTMHVNQLSIRNIPTSSAGLPSGAVWRCTLNNTLRIVL